MSLACPGGRDEWQELLGGGAGAAQPQPPLDGRAGERGPGKAEQRLGMRVYLHGLNLLIDFHHESESMSL